MRKNNFIKKLIPRRIKSIIKLWRAEFNVHSLKDSLVENSGRQKIVLFGTPIHGNIGDHLIAEAELMFLKKYVPDVLIYEIPLEFYELERCFLSHVIGKDDLILISGGGWLGSLWPYEEKIVHEICDFYKENMIVIFPQTIYYESNNPIADKLLHRAQKIYKDCKNLTLTVRDKQSYKFAISNFQCDILLLPDMALIYDLNYSNKKKVNIKVVMCLRNDRERELSNKKRTYLESSLKKVQVIKIDTVINKNINPKNRKQYINNICNIMREAHLVITDRLHGMLMATISGVPCLAVDNSTSKVRNVYETWLRDNQDIIFLTDLTRLNESIDILLQNTHCHFNNDRYIDLLDILGNRIKNFFIH